MHWKNVRCRNEWIKSRRGIAESVEKWTIWQAGNSSVIPLGSAEPMRPGQVQHCLVQMNSECPGQLWTRATLKECYFSFSVFENHGRFSLRGVPEIKGRWGNWGWEKGSHLSFVTEQTGDSVRTEPWHAELPILCPAVSTGPPCTLWKLMTHTPVKKETVKKKTNAHIFK